MFDPNTKFLVVDDFKTMRSIVKKTLQNMGYNQIEEAEDGNQAFEAMSRAQIDGKPFQCIVCDWNMPNLSGFDLLKKVRGTDGPYKNIPFILVTAENEQKQVLEAAKAGVSNYIVKPFTPADFQTKLQQVYNKHFAKKAA
jgi:two-component system chemotaxis response regulator CheY